MTKQEILTLLMRIEWQGDEVHYLCPSCRASRMHGHMKSCDLNKAIGALNREVQGAAGDHEDVA